MAKHSWLLIAALPLSISSSWGADFYYRQQEKGTVYVAEQKGEKDEILSELPDVNFSRLWRIANLANNQETRLLSDFNPDKFDWMIGIIASIPGSPMDALFFGLAKS